MTDQEKSFGQYWNELTDEQRGYFKDYIDRQKEAYHKSKVEAISDDINDLKWLVAHGATHEELIEKINQIEPLKQ